jgi:FKBP-type peptidyl-prolyl cis-trans isomerase FklB
MCRLSCPRLDKTLVYGMIRIYPQPKRLSSNIHNRGFRMYLLRLLTAAITLSLLSMPTFADAALNSEKQKLSYAMGIFFSQSITQQNIDLDVPAFLQAIDDVLNKSEPKLSREEMQTILTKYQEEQTRQQLAMAEKNLADGKKFLADNKGNKDVTELPSGLQYKIIKEGAGEKPAATNSVTVHYRGTLIDGTEFDSSYSRGEPVQLQLPQVIKGWQEALPLMKANSKWQIYVPSELAYGPRGAGSLIGPNATLIFDIELIAIN